MNILIIDTATPVEIVACSSDEKVVDITMKVYASHSITLFKSIDQALKETNIGLNALDLLGVGIGPGSFTGIRIAVTTARMFSQILHVPLVGIKTHLMYAVSASKDAGPGENILIAFDAKKGRVFAALYAMGKEDSDPIEILKPGDYEIGHLRNHLNTKEKTILIGDGCERYYNEMKCSLSEYNLLSDYIPSGAIICNHIKRIYSADPDNYRDLNRVVPYYSRKPDAEIIKGLR